MKDGGFDIMVGGIGPFFNLMQTLWIYARKWKKSENQTERELGTLLFETLEEYYRNL